jgi:hypothetical protein
MADFRLTSNLISRFPGLISEPTAVIRICDTDFAVKYTLLPFISTALEE